MSLIQSFNNYLQIYLSRPTVVASDMFLLLMGVGVLVGVLLLSRKVKDLSIAIQRLQNEITNK